MTVDVEALWANRDQTYRYMPAALTPPATQPAQPAEAAPINESTNAPACTAAAVEPKCTAEVPEESVPKKTGNLLDELPAFKAAMESLEKRGISIFDSEPTKSTEKERAKAKPAKRKRKRKPLAARATVHPTTLRKQRRPRTQDEIDLSRHRRRCGVCHDPQREAIEQAFIQWRNADWIDDEFEPEGGRSAIYRHAHAFNLFKKRSLNLRSALEYIIEESERITPSAEGIVKAMRAYTRINDVGEWIDPPTKHIVQVIAIPATQDGNAANPIAGLALDVRKDRSQIIESGIRQPLLTETAPQSESVATD
jgi:hypothetical protein